MPRNDIDTIKARIESLQERVRSADIGAYVLYGSDPHNSEIPPDCWRDRAWLSGFTGSAGTVAVTRKNAALWTDGRYAVEAREMLAGTGIQLYQTAKPDEKTIPQYLIEELEEGDVVGMNGEVVSIWQARRLEKKLSKAGIKVDTDLDLVGDLWVGRPARPRTPVVSHPEKFAGKASQTKIDELREKMREKDVDHFLISKLEEIAWLFNIRGNDIEYTPVALAFAIVSFEHAAIFLDRNKLSKTVRERFKDEKIEIFDYDAVVAQLNKLSENDRIGYDPKSTSCLLYNAIASSCTPVEVESPIARMKSIKNDVEISNFKDVMVCDGIAMCKFLYWLDREVKASGVTELDASRKLEEYRKEQPNMRQMSFRTITAYGPNAALPHYSTTDENCSELQPEGLYLVDSGGNYLGGTTDITRTVALGPTTQDMRRDFTLVLKGVINLTQTRFLAGTTGGNLDVLARTAMWAQGIDYKHSTGHGVGSYLNIHEGPCGFSLKNKEKFRPGMVVTIEPGRYREENYGIRIENMVVVAEDIETEDGKFYRFETLTQCPIDTSLVERDLLSSNEREWLNDYHQGVDSKLSPHLTGQVLDWLHCQTQPI